MGSGTTFARSRMVQAYAASPLVSALRLLQEPYAAAAWLLRPFLELGSSSWPRTPPAVWVGRSAFVASNVAAVGRQLEQSWPWIWIWISVVSQLMQLLPRQLLQLLPRQVLQLLPAPGAAHVPALADATSIVREPVCCFASLVRWCRCWSRSLSSAFQRLAYVSRSTFGLLSNMTLPTFNCASLNSSLYKFSTASFLSSTVLRRPLEGIASILSKPVLAFRVSCISIRRWFTIHGLPPTTLSRRAGIVPG